MASWLNLYSEEAWDEAVVRLGRQFTGFPERTWKRAQTVDIGDTLLCYMIRGRGFFGIMEVTGYPYRDDDAETILDFEDAYWIPWRLTLQLPDDSGVRPPDLPELSWIKNRPKNYWSMRVRQTLVRIADADAEIIVAALQSAAKP